MTTTAARPAIRHSHPYPAVREVHAASCARIESVRAAGGIELVDYLDQRADLNSAENTEALVDCLGDNITDERRIELRASSAAIVLECARTAAHVLGLDVMRLAPSDMVALLDYYRRLRLLA